MDSISESSSSDIYDVFWLFPKSHYEHNIILQYLSAQKLLGIPNPQFESNVCYFVLLFGPTSYIFDSDRLEQKIQITREQFYVIKSFLDDNCTHGLSNTQSNTANTADEESVPNVPPRISATKSRDNEPLTTAKKF